MKRYTRAARRRFLVRDRGGSQVAARTFANHPAYGGQGNLRLRRVARSIGLNERMATRGPAMWSLHWAGSVPCDMEVWHRALEGFEKAATLATGTPESSLECGDNLQRGRQLMWRLWLVQRPASRDKR
jgi:hypothetical protein